MSQVANILEYLRSGRTLTKLEALRKFRCLSLNSRAAELRKRLKGRVRIDCRRVERNGRVVYVYSMPRKGRG